MPLLSFASGIAEKKSRKDKGWSAGGEAGGDGPGSDPEGMRPLRGQQADEQGGAAAAAAGAARGEQWVLNVDVEPLSL